MGGAANGASAPIVAAAIGLAGDAFGCSRHLLA